MNRAKKNSSKSKSKITSSGNNSSKKTNSSRSKASDTHNDGSDDEAGSVCLICAEKISIVALSPCNHPTCHKCSLRQRALYEKKQCLFCRSEVNDVIFTDDLTADYNELNSSFNFKFQEEKLGIRFTSEGVMNRSLELLKYKCSFGDTAKDFGSFKKLNEHLKHEHNRTLCMICANQKRAFPSELEVMTTKQLKVHETRGDPKTGFKGHPLCGFCPSKRFYSDDEFYKHMRLSHEKCHICDQLDPSQPQYFKCYDDLFQHFKAVHYVCTVQSCLDAKFVVFRDEFDLKAHIIKEHPGLMGDSRRAMTLIDNNPKKFRSEISTFTNPVRGVQADSSGAGASKEMKRKRMEQRARHYLNESKQDFQSFLNLNDLFNKGEMTAQELFSQYQDLFQSHKADVHLLIYDLSELYYSTSDKHKQLRSIYDSVERKNQNSTMFKPLVADTTTAVNVVRGKWGAASKSGPVGGTSVKFTSLPPVSDSIFSSQKVSYTGLKNGRSSTSSPVVKTGLSSKSSSSVSLNYAKNNQQTNLPTVNSQPNVTAIKSSTVTEFPKLQAPKKKFTAPPVKQPVIPSSSSWGRQPNSSIMSSESLELNSLDGALPDTGRKKKGKQKQLLFHIGV